MARPPHPLTLLHVSGGAVLVVALVATLAVSFASVMEKPRHGEPGGVTTPVDHYVARIHAAVAAGRISLAAFEWQEAYAVALASRQWANLITVGDAAVAIGDATGTHVGWTTKARDCYRSALFRARGQASVDGVLAATQAFARLGDTDRVAEGIALALSLSPEPTSQARVREVAQGLNR
jgi:hypothetical protein